LKRCLDFHGLFRFWIRAATVAAPAGDVNR
jgi:hypothetical protein